jgi:hypothetical protein
MADRPPKHRPQTDFRHRSQIPLPAVAEVAHHVTDLLSPSLLAQRPLERRDPRPPPRLIRMRQRRLTLPVMGALMVRLVWRRMPAVAEVQKVLARDGLWWAPLLRVRPQALTTRLDALPAAVLGQLCTAVCTRRQAQAPTALPEPRWAPVRAHVPQVTMVEGSTLDARRQKTPGVRERAGLVRAGTSIVLVDACSHDPLWPLYTAERRRQGPARCRREPGGRAGGGAAGVRPGVVQLSVGR